MKSNFFKHQQRAALFAQMRKDAKYTQERLAELINKTRDWVNKLERCNLAIHENLTCDTEGMLFQVCGPKLSPATQEKALQYLKAKVTGCEQDG